MSRPMLMRTIPFALFMGFVGLEELLRYLSTKQILLLDPSVLLLTYPIKTLAVGGLLLYFAKNYKELVFRDLLRADHSLLSTLTGLLIFFLWIQMDWDFATVGTPAGFNPTQVQDSTLRWTLTLFRIAGASLVVPVMEEIFWRSFLIRYIQQADFSTVPLGTFTWGSFFLSAVLFGLEHNLVAAGIMAGFLFNLLLYRTRSLAQCILSHAVANFALGIYVLYTGRWHFW